MSRLIAVGDVHGCYNEMMALIDKLQATGEDTVVFLGDYVDRGPDGKKVIDQLIKWSKENPRWVFLFGNHEDIFIDHVMNKATRYGISNWYANGGKPTRDSYMPEGLDEYAKAISQVEYPNEHLQFIVDLPLWYETDDYFFVHGGVLPYNDLEDSKTHRDTLLWARDSFIMSDNDWGKKIIFGHTPQLPSFEPWVMDNKIGLDTAVCPPRCNKLTAVVLPEEKFVFQEYING